MKRSNIVMTIDDVMKELRSVGIPATRATVADNIADGHWPFGRVVKTSPTGKRQFEIFRVDFQVWLKSKTPKEVITNE